MKLLFPSTFFTLALINTPPSTHAFAPIKLNNRLSTNLQMVGFRDPREKDNMDAMKALKILDNETKKVKRWLAELMEPDEEENDDEAAAPAAPAVEDIGLFGGGGMATTTSPTVDLPSYKPSLRNDLGTSVLLTGTYHPALLRALNNNDFGSRESLGGGESGDLIPNFRFETIILSIKGEEGAKEAKKRVISRDARYSGLLDKLVIEAEESLLPAKERMEGVTSWIVRLEAGETAEMLPSVAELAKGATDLKNVIVIVEGVDSMTCTVDGWDEFSQGSNTFKTTLLAVGELYDQPGSEGKFYHIGNIMGDDTSSIEFTNVDATAPKMLRSDAYLTLANLLALNGSANKSFGAYEYSPQSMETIRSSIEERKKIIKEGETEPVDAPEDDEWKGVKYANRLVRAMREMGFSRLAELDVLLEKGVNGYIEFLNAPPKPRTKSAEERKKDKWDELDEKIMAQLEKETAEIEAKREEEEAKKTLQEIKGMARDWAIRQYTLKSLVGEVGDMTEREFIKSIWHDAMEEGRKLHEFVNSEEYAEKMKKPTPGALNTYFYKGMDPREKRRREIILEKVTQEYMDAYVGEDGLDAEESEESLAVDN